MWVKEHPKKKEGYYWVRFKGSHDFIYKGVFLVYKDKDSQKYMVYYGDEYEYSVDDKMFVEWWDERIIGPSSESGGREFDTEEEIMELMGIMGYRGKTFSGAVKFAISLNFDVCVRSNGYFVEPKEDSE